MKKTVSILLLLAVLALGITIRINNIDKVQLRSPDEQIYTYQAGNMARIGGEAVKLLVKEYNSNKMAWIYPPPSRIGYLWPLSAVMKSTHSADVKIGSYVSCAFSIISLLLLILIGLRFFNQWVALFALLFLSVSPLDLAIACRTWQDAMFGCLGLLLIYLCCEITRFPHKIIWYVIFVLAGSYCLLIKELGAIVYGLCMIWLLWLLLVRRKIFSKGILLMALGALGAIATTAILAHALGGIGTIIEILTHIKEALPTNTYAIEYQSGPWYQFLLGFWIISPASTILCLVGITGIFLHNAPFVKKLSAEFDQKNSAIFGMIFFMAAFMAIVIAMPYCQNLRYVSVLYAPFYLMSGLGLWYIILFFKTMLNKIPFFVIMICFGAAAVSVAVSDYRNFKKIFVRTGIVDISIKLLKQFSR